MYKNTITQDAVADTYLTHSITRYTYSNEVFAIWLF